ncbi:serine hydrolase [Streptomyces sp. Tue6028]|uniref:serine hydrolase n=1 Tax=Streptomyces sp. Tue6028 TaxID=2036037 RepID=UPI003D72B5C9
MSDSHPNDIETGRAIPAGHRPTRTEVRRLRRVKRRRVTGAVAAGAVLAGAAALCTARWLSPSDGGTPTAPTGQATASAPTPPGSVDLASALAPVTSHLGTGTMSVALLDPQSNRWAEYGRGIFDTASIVKVDILSTLLLQAQDAGRDLTARERSLTTAMIENSDNDATSALWSAIGRASALDKANTRLGLRETTGGEGTVWGLTQTTALDQVRLLAAVFGDRSPLGSAARAYIQHLMYHVAPDQDWGVSVAADPGRPTALKNGWLQRSQSSKWDINSIGRIVKDGRVFYLAVLLNGSSTQEIGISLVERAARSAAEALARTLAAGVTS